MMKQTYGCLGDFASISPLPHHYQISPAEGLGLCRPGVALSYLEWKQLGGGCQRSWARSCRKYRSGRGKQLPSQRKARDLGTPLGEAGQPKSPGRLLRFPLALLYLSKPICHLQPCSFLSKLVLQEDSSGKTYDVPSQPPWHASQGRNSDCVCVVPKQPHSSVPKGTPDG